MGTNDRLSKKLQNADRKDRMEQKLGIDRTMTKLRDNRASKEFDRKKK